MSTVSLAQIISFGAVVGTKNIKCSSLDASLGSRPICIPRHTYCDAVVSCSSLDLVLAKIQRAKLSRNTLKIED